ncbi:MAG: hypothetical protein DMG85_00790 [Acidobacteria bacterium]|nr:MAG: hypothetical protein DMG85_00790 [Acidobacteriota bacterium]
MHTRVIAVLLFVRIASLSLAAQTGKIEPIGPASDSSVAEGVKKVLDPKGYRVSLDDGSVACELPIIADRTSAKELTRCVTN